MFLYEHAFSIKEHSVGEGLGICFFLQNDSGGVTAHYGWMEYKHCQHFPYYNVTNKMT